MEMNTHREKLLVFLDTVAKPGSCTGDINGDDTNLVHEDIVDSFAIIHNIYYLEQDYGINLLALGIDPADLVTIGGMLSAIERSFD
jgi:hypothetical protein